jgi:hypothetical protein
MKNLLKTALRVGSVAALFAIAAAIAWHGRYQVVGAPGVWTTIDRWENTTQLCLRDIASQRCGPKVFLKVED